ncbi:hypothetical protein ACFDTO_18155 [Microbacteriaceae bacterium 4G12]
MDSTKKLLAACCYFSIFFAPFLFPIIVYFVVSHNEVQYHAKRALLSHMLPVLGGIIILILLTFVNTVETAGAIVVIGFLIVGLLYIAMFIWNVVKGIQLLANE